MKPTIFRFAAFAVIAAQLAACSGGQNAGSVLPSTLQNDSNSVTAQSTTSTPAPSPSPAPLTVVGTVLSADVTKFTISATSPKCSPMYVYYNKTTTKFYPYLGYPITKGMPIQATGTGSCASGIQASTVTYTAAATPPPSTTTTATPQPTATPTVKPTVAPTAAPLATLAPSSTSPAATAFMPSSWGKISAFQVFDDTSNGYITQAAASADGYRYSAVWGSRNNIGTSWNDSNAGLQTGYYNALETDPSYKIWGAIGHDLTWWNANHPDWVLYACTSTGGVTTTPAWVPALNTAIPLDVHNPDVVAYQVRTMANYAHKMGYHALAIDEATFWQADAGAGTGSYGCGIYQNGSFVKRYSGVNDPNWAADVVQWVKIAHSMLTTDPTISTYHLKLLVNHPAGSISNANEIALLANIDADLDETGYVDYGRPTKQGVTAFSRRTQWATYAQQHGVAVLMNANWEGVTVGAPQLDFSVASYLMGNEQAESLFAAPQSRFGLENWHSQYNANIGAPCGTFYADSTSTGVFYRRFANAVVAANASTATLTMHLPTGHSYTDLFGRALSTTIAPGDGYVLMTTNGCN